LYKSLRGTSDILPEEQAYWRYIEERATAICQLYGYQRIDTPAFEETSLFTRSVGQGTDVVDKEMYTFNDHSGTSITLLPEGTAPVCRAYIEHGMYNQPQPVRLFYFASIFRYERPQSGRYRQHRQFGFEAIGDADPALDAEVIEMSWQLYSSLGLRDLHLQLNSIGCRLCRPSYVEALKQYYSEHRDALCPDCKSRLERNPLRLLDCKKQSCLEIARSAPRSIDYLCTQCDDHFNLLQKYLSISKIPLELNHCLVRGLDYYTRTVFEIQPEDEGMQSTLGGGGRYDNLIEELGGRPAPAVGFATGLERVVINMKRQSTTTPPLPQPKVYAAYVGEQAKAETMRLAALLRRAGISATAAMGDKSLKSQMKQANTSKVSYVLIVGENELKKGTVVLRDMVRGEQLEVSSEEILIHLQELTGKDSQ
jgi:histidyl-tRNA synthetase